MAQTGSEAPQFYFPHPPPANGDLSSGRALPVNAATDHMLVMVAPSTPLASSWTTRCRSTVPLWGVPPRSSLMGIPNVHHMLCDPQWGILNHGSATSNPASWPSTRPALSCPRPTPLGPPQGPLDVSQQGANCRHVLFTWMDVALEECLQIACSQTSSFSSAKEMTKDKGKLGKRWQLKSSKDSS